MNQLGLFEKKNKKCSRFRTMQQNKLMLEQQIQKRIKDEIDEANSLDHMISAIDFGNRSE